MPKVKFTPQQNGLHFVNYFTSVIQPFPGMPPITLQGRCGGMSFMALDHYFARMPLPAYTSANFPGTGVPPDGSPLADYIFRRQVQSLLVPSAIHVFTWSVSPDTPTFFVRGVTEQTKKIEFPKLRKAIDQGKPVPLVLIVARNLGELGHNHQVVAYGYDYQAAGDKMTVYIYDCNCPDQEITLTSDGTKPGFTETSPSGLCNKEWRGFFVHDYVAQRPPADLTAVAPKAVPMAPEEVPGRRGLAPAESAAHGRVHLKVAFEGVVFHHAAADLTEDVALNILVNGKAARWPRTGTKVAADGKRYALRQTFNVTMGRNHLLSVSVEPAGGQERAVFAQAGEAAGSLLVQYGAAESWGKGKHKERSVGPAGGYTVEFTVAAAKPRKKAVRR